HEERVERDADAWDDDAAGVLAARGHVVEGGRRAEVDDDAGPARALVGRHRVDDAVGADLPRIVVEERHAGLDARADEERRVTGDIPDEIDGSLGLRLPGT